MNLQLVLQNYGLEEKEAKTYLTLLSLGEVTATILATKAVLDRTLMYQLTNKLIEKGLISYIVKNNVRYFSAAPPRTLLKNLQEKEEEIKSALPELKNLFKTELQETKVEVYRGRKGISAILRMGMGDKKNYYFLGGAHEACSLFEIENVRELRHAIRLGNKGKVLARKQDDFPIGKNEDYRFIPEHMISSTTLLIWGNKTAIFVWKKPHFAILIDDEEIAKSNLATFNYLWEIGEKPTKADRKKRLLKD